MNIAVEALGESADSVGPERNGAEFNSAVEEVHETFDVSTRCEFGHHDQIEARQ